MSTEDQECQECGQRVDVRLRDVLKDICEFVYFTRRVPNYVWVKVSLRLLVWEKPTHQPLLKGIVHRYGAGPVVVMVMPVQDPPGASAITAQK